MFKFVFVCVCVCVRGVVFGCLVERERERERGLTKAERD